MAQKMDQVYAKALWQAVEKGKEPYDAVAAMDSALKLHNRAALWPGILRSFQRLADQEKRRSRVKIWVAREKDVKMAMMEAGVTDADVCIDDTLIGGWRLETNDTLTDATYKKYLSDMFIRATR